MKQRVAHIFSWTIFPLSITATVGGSALLMARGVAPATAIVPFILGGYALIAALERVFPYEGSWLRPQGDLRTDIGLFFTNGAVASTIQPALLAGAVALSGALSRRLGAGLWPADWPLFPQLVLALVVGELFEYSFHRLMHENEWLWRFHATHHSAPRLYWLNAVRFHPVDLFFIGTVRLAALVLLGCGEAVIALDVVFSAIHGSFQHANLQLRLGPLNWIFSMAELHRWHHSKTVEEANHNYGGNVIFWDVVFGTRFLPTDRRPPSDIGIADLPAFPTGFWANLAAPFRWSSIRRASSAS